jgi:methionyl-tRNA formyltransferase
MASQQNDDRHYVVASTKSWNRRVFDEELARLPGHWHFIADRDDLTLERLDETRPVYVFFPHWSWKIPVDVFTRYACVVFHMTDVPYGRGGTPLQNLIVRGHRTTQLTALKVVDEMDAGPVYRKEELSLEGAAEEIYIRAARLSAEMIKGIVMDDPEPVSQEGEVTAFARRKPGESAIPEGLTLEKLYDFIRMLDAEGYPHAFMEHKGFKYKLSRAALRDGHLVADVRIVPSSEGTP